MPTGYTVTINKNNNKYIITNKGEVENPNTVDNIYLYMYILSSERKKVKSQTVKCNENGTFYSLRIYILYYI